jgi:two-component system phosphate regulon response regulator PhoB
MTSLLVADDTPSVRKLFRMIFHSGYRLVEAGDGQEALRQILAERPAVAILDVAMPELNGLDLCRAIRRDPRVASTAVIVITANGGPADRAAALAAGADHFISKPFSPSAMYQLVESVVARQTAVAS